MCFRNVVSGFLVSRSPLYPLLYFITVFVIILVSLGCFTDEIEDLYKDRTYVLFNLELHQN